MCEGGGLTGSEAASRARYSCILFITIFCSKKKRTRIRQTAGKEEIKGGNSFSNDLTLTCLRPSFIEVLARLLL